MASRTPRSGKAGFDPCRRQAPDPEDDIPPLGKVLEFLRLLWALDHGLQRNSKRMLGTIGVTGPQRLVIRIVGRFPGIAAGRLARIILLHPSTLSGVLARLERRGLVERRGDPRDGRRALLRLTPKGRAVNARSAGTIEAAVARALRQVPLAKLDVVSDVLGLLAGSLEGGKDGSGTRFISFDVKRTSGYNSFGLNR